MFSITTYDFKKEDFNSWQLPYEYHYIYILENGKDAYIGETTDIVDRAKEHYNDPKKQIYNFKTIHIITGKKSEETPAKHYERLLIKLMKVDKKFNVINGNDGQNYSEYARKNEFELYFDKLWFLLEAKNLVKTKNFQSIINSEEYKYSPYTSLNKEQIKTLTSIMHVLESDEILPKKKKEETRPILINGKAGTGKTLVAITLIHHLKTNIKYRNKKIAMVIANPNLREEIKYIFSKTDNLDSKDVISPTDVTRNKYDILICDEAHKLRRNINLISYRKNFISASERLNLNPNECTELDWILKQSKIQIFFYDKNQISSRIEIPYQDFENRIKKQYQGTRPIELKKQMRIQAGEKYLKYIHNILHQKQKEKVTFNNYTLKIVDNYPEMQQIIKEKETQFGLSRKASGYGFKYINDGTEHAYDIYVDGTLDKWNSCTKGWIRNPKCIDEVGSIYTLCGIDLNYIGVIISKELYFDKQDNKIKVNKKNFYDNVVKKNTTYEELLTNILNAYEILLTRGLKGTYIYICDKDLREYFKKFIDTD